MDELDRIKRIARRVEVPYDNAVVYLQNVDCDKYINEYKQFYKKMVSNPYDTYIELRERLNKHGSTASFPEYKGIIFYLIKKIYQDNDFNEFCKKDKTMDNFKTILVHEIIAVMIKSRYIYPYKATLLLIEQMLKIIDTYYRVIEDDRQTFLKCQECHTYPKYYHNFRYRVYLTYLLDNINGDQVIMPVMTIGSTDIIKLRCVPILILGVSDMPIRADQYINSPLDFWAHDIQHARRQIQETERYYDIIIKHLKYYDSRSPFDIISKNEFYKIMETFTKEKILPMISLLPLKKPNTLETLEKLETHDTENIDDIEDYNKSIKILNEESKLRKILIFEIIHEKAWPITKFSICRNIKLGHDIFPIENISFECNDEIIPQVNKSIVESCSNIEIDCLDEIFEDPTTLSNTINKLRHGFYDDPDDTNSMIVDEKYRTSEELAKQSLYILEKLGCTLVTKEELINLAKNTKNATEFLQYSKVIKVPDHPEEWNELPIDEIKKWSVEPDAPTNVNQLGGKRNIDKNKHAIYNPNLFYMNNK